MVHYKYNVPIADLWEEERSCLLVLPEYEYQVYRYEPVHINKYGYVTVDTNKYGISPELSGQTVQVKIFFDKVEIYQLLSTLKNVELMVIDEIGFVPLYKEASELLFQVIIECYERESHS